MTTATENNTERTTQANIIPEAQKDLGTPEERHFTKKEPLLKITVGQITSNLALAQYYDENSHEYLDPRPAYSIYFTENVKGSDGSISRKITSIPIPKDSASIRALGEHLQMVAKAIDGIELSRSSDVDDLSAALEKLKAFKQKA